MKKKIDWLVGVIVTLIFFYAPSMIYHYLNISHYKITFMILGLFLIYCIVSLIYYIKNKDTKMVYHYALMIAVYTLVPFTILFIAAYNSGM